jgi:hypothetical protein
MSYKRFSRLGSRAVARHAGQAAPFGAATWAASWRPSAANLAGGTRYRDVVARPRRGGAKSSLNRTATRNKVTRRLTGAPGIGILGWSHLLSCPTGIAKKSVNLAVGGALVYKPD